LHGAAHIAQHPVQLVGQNLPLGSGDYAVACHQNKRFNRIFLARSRGGGHALNGSNLALRIALHTHQRVNNPVRRAVAAIDGHGDRVHQKRHVVMHDLHHRVLADEAVFRQRGVEHAHFGALRGAWRVKQAPMRVGNRVQRGGAKRRDLVGVRVFKIGRYKAGLPLGRGSGMLLRVAQ